MDKQRNFLLFSILKNNWQIFHEMVVLEKIYGISNLVDKRRHLLLSSILKR